MGRGRETELPIALEPTPLGQQVEAETTGPPFSGREGLPSGNHESETGDPFDAFIGRRDEVIDMGRREIQGDGTKTAHGIHKVGNAEFSGQGAEFRHGIDNSGGGFAMNRCHVGEGRVGRQGGAYRFEVGGLVFGENEFGGFDAQHGAHGCHALAIGAIDDQQHLAPGTDGRGEDGFDGKGATALHGHRDVRFGVYLSDMEQSRPNRGDQLNEGMVPGAEIPEEGLLHRLAGGQGSGCEEDFIFPTG